MALNETNEPEERDSTPVHSGPADAQRAPGRVSSRPLPAGSKPTVSHPVASRPVPTGSSRPVARSKSSTTAPTAATPSVQKFEEDEDDPDAVDPELQSFIKNTPPWLISTVVHLVGFLILGLIPFLVDRAQPPISIVTTPPVEESKEDPVDDMNDKKDDQLKIDSEDPEITDALSISDLPEVEDPFAAPQSETLPMPEGNESASTDVKAPNPGMALSGRELGSKRGHLLGNGGSDLTEAAVQRALAWLARNQRADGLWSLTGPYPDGASINSENVVAATSMALLAFQGNGHTHKTGKYKPNVVRAWNALLPLQNADGSFIQPEMPTDHHYYAHAQASIALCELYAMTKDSHYKKPAQLAVDFLVANQHKAGGWRYGGMASGSDLSVTGWVVMALQSGRMGGLNVPQETLANVTKYLDNIQTHGGSRYVYKRGDSIGRPSMDAEGLLLRQYLGWKQDHKPLVEGVTRLVKEYPILWMEKTKFSNKKHPNDVYYWYYATQVAHHLADEPWWNWNADLRTVVPKKQVRGGDQDGSWDPLDGDVYCAAGGRLFTTCMLTYMLEVYYRHLPLYDIYDSKKRSQEKETPKKNSSKKNSSKKKALKK